MCFPKKVEWIVVSNSLFFIAYAHCMVFRCLLLSDHHVFFFFVANFSASEWVEWH